MLAGLRAAIKARLEDAYPFRAVESGFSQRALQSPPAAVFFLVSDTKQADEPAVTRVLTYEIALLVSYTDPVKAQEQIEEMLDMVRPSFTGWLPAETGCQPMSVPEFRFQGVEGTLLIYTGRVTIEVYPDTPFP
jgi:hypothetical protein